MKLGLVGWPSDTGVGMELRDALRYLPAVSVFYMDHPGKPPAADFQGKTAGPSDLLRKMASFIESHKLDTILTWETPGSWDFPALWASKGVRWFCVAHYDWFAPKQLAAWKTAKIIVPFEGAREGLRTVYGLESTTLQVPVDLERLPFQERKKAERFVTVYGHGGPGDRRAILQILEAWRLMGPEAPPLMVRSQKPIKEIENTKLPDKVTIEIGNLRQAHDLYAQADVAILPSESEGVGCSLIEAQASGLSVITTNLKPMKSIAPEYLVEGILGHLEIMEGHPGGDLYAPPHRDRRQGEGSSARRYLGLLETGSFPDAGTLLLGHVERPMDESSGEGMKHTLEHSKRPTDIHQHLVTLHGLVTGINAKTVIELGVNTAESTVALLEAVAATDGILTSVDIQDLPQTRPMLEGYGLTGRWQFHMMDDIKFGLEVWPKGKLADLIFVDTSHQYAQTKREIEVFEPILRPGGIMVFHDTVSFYQGVQKPINEFLKKNKWPYENKTNCNGLGILRKPA